MGFGHLAPATPFVSNAEEALPRSVRLLHINSGNLYGGVETMLSTFGRLHDRCPGMQSQFALCHEGRLSHELRSSGCEVHLLGNARLSRPWTVQRVRQHLRRLLEREQYDLVICHMPWSLAVFGGTVRSAGQRLGFWAHSLHTGRSWLEILARSTGPNLAISNSHFTKAGIANIFPGVPCEIIYPPVELNMSPEAHQWRATIRAQQGIGDDTIVIMQVSRLEEWKGHLLHLEALSRLKDLGNWTCWMVGGPQKRSEEAYLRKLRAAAVELGLSERVRFLGHRTDVRRLLSAADVFCQPNQQPEPFGIVFIEALWANRPVVTTNMGGAAEIVDANCGLLVDSQDAGLLAEALRSLIQSRELRLRLGLAGSQRALALCEPAAQMEKLREIALTAIGLARRTKA